MIGAGTFINPLLKVITVVAVLAASYVFIVRPILDTTEEEVERVAGQIESSQEESARQGEALDLEFSRDVALSYAQSLRAGSQPWGEASRAVTKCVREAGTNAVKMEHCESFGEILTTEALSDRNFATSYADSLAAQGQTAEAKRVRDCVADAGFKAAPMQRCYDLADQLLFG